MILIRNTPGQSVYNPVKYVIDNIRYPLQVIAATRKMISIPQIENKIKQLGSMKEFCSKYKANKEYIKAYIDSIRPALDMIEEGVGYVLYAGRRIKVLPLATEEEIKDRIAKFRE